MSLRFELPARDTLSPNNDHDPLPYYYRPWIGRLFRHRLQMGLSLLPADGSGCSRSASAAESWCPR